MSRNKDYENMLFTDGKTKQEFKDDADINRIIEKWLKTGHAPAFLEQPGKQQKYNVDVSSAGDFHQAMNAIKATERLFGTFNARIRDRFDNDPEKFLKFMENPKNTEEAIKLGLVKGPDLKPEPMLVKVVPPEAPPEDKKPK